MSDTFDFERAGSYHIEINEDLEIPKETKARMMAKMAAYVEYHRVLSDELGEDHELGVPGLGCE